MRRRDHAGAVSRARPAGRDEARPDAGLGGGPAAEEAIRELVARPGAGRRRARRGVRRRRRRRPLDRRPDRRDEERTCAASPVWATLLALEREGAVDVGVVSAPALGRRWWAARGGGALRATAGRCRVSRVARGRGLRRCRRRRTRSMPAGLGGARRRSVGERAASATSGSTAWSPRERSTSRWRTAETLGLRGGRAHRRGSRRPMHDVRRRAARSRRNGRSSRRTALLHGEAGALSHGQRLEQHLGDRI